jgi:hypothetical protein
MRELIQTSSKQSFDSSNSMVPNRWQPSIASSGVLAFSHGLGLVLPITALRG